MNFRYRFVDRIGIINVSISKYTFHFMFNRKYYFIQFELNIKQILIYLLYIILYLKNRKRWITNERYKLQYKNFKSYI